MLPSFDRAIQVNFRNTVERRMTAVSLATRLYAIDHGGKLPSKLDELVPKYLPALPLDPFASTPQQPLKYITMRGSRSSTASATTGSMMAVSELPSPKAQSRKRADLGRWDKLDAVVHLKFQPRVMPNDPQVNDVGAGRHAGRIYPNEKAIRAGSERARRRRHQRPRQGGAR
jgi:hypothetical protein